MWYANLEALPVPAKYLKHTSKNFNTVKNEQVLPPARFHYLLFFCG